MTYDRCRADTSAYWSSAIVVTSTRRPDAPQASDMRGSSEIIAAYLRSSNDSDEVDLLAIGEPVTARLCNSERPHVGNLTDLRDVSAAALGNPALHPVAYRGIPSQIGSGARFPLFLASRAACASSNAGVRIWREPRYGDGRRA
jgi:hypothetical protein